MPVPTLRTALLLAAGLLVPLLLGGGGAALAALLVGDAALLALVLLDASRAPGAAAFSAERTVRQPLAAFAANAVTLRLRCDARRSVRVELADAPPAAFDAAGHRRPLALPAGGAAAVRYEVVPRARGDHAFGDLHLRILGPAGLAWRPVVLPLAQTVAVYPDLRRLARLDGAGQAEVGRAVRHGWRDGGEFRSLRLYAAGDDVRSIDWKATARRAAPVVREWQPERNQSVWLLLDQGRHLAARLPDGRSKLDHAVDAALALARAAAARGDRTGAVLFGAEVERVVPAAGGRAALGPLAEALHLAEARAVESDYAAAFEALVARQRRRALVVLFTDLADPDTSALLLARAAALRRRHLVLVAALSDSAVAEAAAARPGDAGEAYERVAAERILDEREAAARRLVASGVAVASVPAGAMAAAVVARYVEAKARGSL